MLLWGKTNVMIALIVYDVNADTCYVVLFVRLTPSSVNGKEETSQGNLYKACIYICIYGIRVWKVLLL